ncbi:hypothetical protein Goshw_008908, partial [Gossypium schwendimanii]|nr:hypothetical protein [Gossypium schwendimanii]
SSITTDRYLREALFLHVALVGRQCKLDPKIISALVERWRPKTHTFHLSYGDCTITLEDVHLQLGYPWTEDSTEEEREQYAQVYILQIIEGDMWGDAIRKKSKLVISFYYYNYGLSTALHFYVLEWNHAPSHVGLPTKFEDIWLLLDQRSEADVPLVVYATIEMHEADRVLRQFRFQQSIHVAPQDLDDLHRIDLRQSDTNWSIHGKPYLYGKKRGDASEPHISRSRQGTLNLMGDKVGPSSVPMQELTPTTLALMPTPPPFNMYHLILFYIKLNCWSSIPNTIHARAISFPDGDDAYNDVRPFMHEASTEIPLIFVLSQPPIYRPKDARWQPLIKESTSTEGKPQQRQPHSEAKPRRNPARNR